MPYCKVCGRPLKDEESIRREIGPVCFAQIKASSETKEIVPLPVPGEFEGNIVLTRDKEGIAMTNVPRFKIFHSPDGYEWGYSGSGPADLALNILLLFVEESEAYRLHQQFKSQFVASMPEEGGIIENKDIRNWLAKQTELWEVEK
ncbi:MAG TPA: DUF6011 domain-containing protein [Mesotoga sp.]|nr:DUF6011 domain-containing protein [Mesotoga sp.]